MRLTQRLRKIIGRTTFRRPKGKATARPARIIEIRRGETPEG